MSRAIHVGTPGRHYRHLRGTFYPYDLKPRGRLRSRCSAVLRRWADRLRGCRDEGQDIWLFFDNDQAGHAVKSAMALRRRIEPDPANPKYLLTVWGVGYKFADT